MKKVITTMLVAAMVLSMAMPTSAATITRKKSTGTTASTTKVSGDYSLKMVDKTLQFIRGGKVVSSIETKDGKITLRKSSAGGVSVVFTDANGKRRNITLGKQKTVALSGTFVQVSVDKALGSSYEVEMEKGSKVTNFYAKGAAKVALNGSVTTLNVTSSNANVAANGTVSRAYAVNKKAISGMSSGKITQTSTGTSASGSVNTTGSGSSSSSNTTVNSGSGSGSSSSSSGSGIIINGGGSNNGGNSTSKRNPKVTASSTAIPTYDEGTVLNTIPLAQFGLKATYGNTEVAGKFAFNNPTSTVAKGERTYSIVFTPTDSKTYNSATINVKINGKEVVKTQTLAEAKKAIEDRLATLSVDNKVTEATIKELADNEIKAGSGITATVADYVKTPATTTAPGSVTATITLTKGNETETIKVNLPIAQLSAIDEAKAAVEAVLNELKAGKDTDKAAVEAALAEVIAKYKDVKISVGDVALDETAKTVSVKVTLTEGDGEPVEVSKTWTYTDPAENTDLADAVKAVEALNANSYADVDAAVKAIEAAVAKVNPDIKVDTSKVALNEDKTTIAGEVGLSLTIDNKEEKATANFSASVTAADKAVAPTFETDLDEATQNIIINKENPAVLTVKAVSTDGGDISYQWYKNSVKDPVADEKLAIPNATGETYAPTTTGTAFYYVIATNTLGESKASTPSKCARVIVSYPEGSAQEPVIANTSKLSDATYNQRDTISALEVDASVDQGELSYQWYKTDSAVAENGTPIQGATLASYTPPKELGTNYYYCVVTNKDTSVTEGMQEVSVKTKAVKISVVATVAATITPVNNEDGTTTQITFTFVREIPNLETATKDDFTLTGKGTHTDGDCTLKIDRVVPRADNKQITLDISGVDMTEDADVEFTKTFDGFQITPAKATIKISKSAKPTPEGKVTVSNFTRVNGSKTADTTEVSFTLSKEFAIAKAGDITIDGATVKTIATTDNKNYTVTIDLDKPTGSETSTTLTLKTITGVDITAGKEETVTAYYDTTPPVIEEVQLNTKNPKELFVFFNEKVVVTGTASSIFTYTGSAGISTAKVATDKENCIVLTLDNPGTLNTTLAYKGTGNDVVTDVSVSENTVASTAPVAVAATDSTAADATKVKIDKIETKTVNGSIVAFASVNTPVKINVNDTTSLSDNEKVAKELAKAFKVTIDGKDYTPEKVEIVTTAPRAVNSDPGSYFKFTFASSDKIPADAVITNVKFTPETVAEKVEVVSYFKPETKVEEIVVEAEASKPLESDLKILSAVPAGLPTSGDKVDIEGRGHKNNGKYSVSMSGNEITVTVNDQLVAYDDIHVNKVDANGSQAFTPVLVQVNKTYGTAKSEQKTGEEPTDTEYLTITNKTTGKSGNWDSADILDVANFDAEAAARKDTFALWVEGDKGGTTNYSIKTAEGETAINFSVKVVPFTGDSAVGLAQLKATPEKVFKASEEPVAKADPVLEGFKVTVDSASIPKTATEVWYVAAQEGNSSIEYGDNINQVAPDNSAASKTATGTKVKITPKDGAYVTETISEFASIANNARSTPTWGDSSKYCGFVHIYAADKDGKIVGYVVVNVPKGYIPEKVDSGSDGGQNNEQVVASINVDEKTDKNDDVTIGASDEKKD